MSAVSNEHRPRAVLTASLMRDEMLAQEPDQVETIVKGILMDLEEHDLAIVKADTVKPGEVRCTCDPEQRDFVPSWLHHCGCDLYRQNAGLPLLGRESTR